MKLFRSISASFLLFQAVHALLVYEEQLNEFVKQILTDNDKCKDLNEVQDQMLDYLRVDKENVQLFVDGQDVGKSDAYNLNLTQSKVSRTIEFYTSKTIYTLAWKQGNIFTYLSNLGSGKVTVRKNLEHRHTLIHRNALFVSFKHALYLGEGLGDVSCVGTGGDSDRVALECGFEMILPEGQGKAEKCMRDRPCYLLDDYFAVHDPDGFNIVYMSMDSQNRVSLDIVVLFHNDNLYVRSKEYECHKVKVDSAGSIQIPLKFVGNTEEEIELKLDFTPENETLNVFDRLADSFLGVYKLIGLVNKYGHVRTEFYIFFGIEIVMLCGMILLCLVLNVTTDVWKLLAFPFVMGYRGLFYLIYVRKGSETNSVRTYKAQSAFLPPKIQIERKDASIIFKGESQPGESTTELTTGSIL